MNSPRAVTGRSVVTAVVTDPEAADRSPGAEARAAVSDVELRADLAGDLDPARIRRPRGQVIYSLRSTLSGGLAGGATADRHARLLAAASRYDVVELEADLDLVPPLLDAIPAHRRRIAWYGPTLNLPALRKRFDQIAQVPADLYLMAPAATRVEHALTPLQLLRELDRRDVTAFGTGPAGAWSRLLAPWLGASVVFGQWSADPADPSGTPTVEQLVTDYGFPTMTPVRDIYGIAGERAARSLSPRLHNAAYRARGLPALFLPFPMGDFLGFWASPLSDGLDSLGFELRGLTVTSPCKEAALTVSAGSIGAKAAGAANIVVRRPTGWHAYTTDGTAALSALRERTIGLTGSAAAVIGCGGAGRSAAAELARAGARVTLVNRGPDRGRSAAVLLGLPVTPLTTFDPAPYSIVVNATPVCDELPFHAGELAEDTVVLDFVYGARESALIGAARGRGLTTIDGWEILLREVRRQFGLMTSRVMPDDVGLLAAPPDVRTMR